MYNGSRARILITVQQIYLEQFQVERRSRR